IDPLLRLGLALVGGAVAVVVVLLLRRCAAAWRTCGGRDDARGRRCSGSLLTLDYAALDLIMMIAWRFPAGYSILARYWLPIVVPLLATLGAAASRRPGSTSSRLALGAAAMLIVCNLVVSVVYLVR